MVTTGFAPKPNRAPGAASARPLGNTMAARSLPWVTAALAASSSISLSLTVLSARRAATTACDSGVRSRSVTATGKVLGPWRPVSNK